MVAEALTDLPRRAIFQQDFQIAAAGAQLGDLVDVDACDRWMRRKRLPMRRSPRPELFTIFTFFTICRLR